MMGRKNRTESCVSEVDFTPLVEISESVPTEDFIQSVPMDAHKNREVSDKVLNEVSDEEGDNEVFPEKTAEGKNKKRERTEVDKVSNEVSDVDLEEEKTPMKKKRKNLQVRLQQRKLQGGI